MATPHENSPIYTTGTPMENAKTVLILLHGRGANAEDILSLAPLIGREDMAILAPEAEGYTWYPNRFIFPVEQNEPHLSAALAKVHDLVLFSEQRGISAENIFIGGFSQGACLASEYVIRNPRRYGGLLVFSGGYIGAFPQVREAVGDLAGTPVFVGCSDVDPHIPLQRVQHTSALLKAMGGEVTERIYRGMGHTINDEEILLAKALIENE